jgi:hypothetical protein
MCEWRKGKCGGWGWSACSSSWARAGQVDAASHGLGRVKTIGGREALRRY